MGTGQGKKSQKGESSSGKAHIAEEDQEEAEEETLLTEKRKKRTVQEKGVASAPGVVEEVDEEGFAYGVCHFELPQWPLLTTTVSMTLRKLCARRQRIPL